MTAMAPVRAPQPLPKVWPAARSFFRWLARRRIGRRLDGLHVSGLDPARALLAARPVLFAVTHVSRWDPLVLLVLDEALGGDGRALMDAGNLDRLPFFAWLGALPVDRSGAARVRSGLRAAAAVLDRPGRALWVFPQGRHRAPHLRPLELERGVAWLATLSGAMVVPVGLCYGFREREGPAAVVTFGVPIPAQEFNLSRLELELAAAVQRGDAYLDTGAGAYTEVVSGAGSADDWATRVLAWVVRRLG